MKGAWYLVLALGLLAVGFVAVFVACVEGARGRRTRANLLEPLGLLVAACGALILSALPLIYGWFWLLQVPYELAVGWVKFLDRAERNAEPDAWAVVSAVACLAGVVVGSHLLLRWLAATAERPWPWKRTLQLVALVVLMFASGVAFTGLVQQTGWLIRTPDAVVYDKSRLL
jgi:hypothetical protein